MRFVGDGRPVDLPVLQASKFRAEFFSVGWSEATSDRAGSNQYSALLERQDCTLVAWYRSLYAPRTGGAYDSHHRTAGIAGRTRRHGLRVATPCAGAAARADAAHRRAHESGRGDGRRHDCEERSGSLAMEAPSPRHVLCSCSLPDIEVSEDCGYHCALRPMILIKCSMFSTSLATSLLISCGVLLATMLPFSVNFAISSGVWAAFTNSRFSLSTMAVGVPAGANTPAQSATLCAPSPASIKVGMSGSAGSRVSASTASARSFLASIFDRALLKEARLKSTRPVMRSAITGAPPR